MDALRSILKTYGRDRLELEFRLGHSSGKSFVPGVTPSAWTTLKTALDTSPAFRVHECHTDEHICGAGKYVVPVQSSDTPHWVYKKRLVDQDSQTQSAWACRMSVSLEERGDGAPPTTYTFRRQKRRWSYVHKCWSIDLTRVTSNLPHQLDNDQESYEVEIELRDTTEFFVRRVDHIIEWGHMLVDDMCRLMNTPTNHGLFQP